MRRIVGIGVTAVVTFAAAGLLLAACGGTSAQNAASDANDKLQSQVYQSQHNIEFRNYNLRQKIADDPSVILWCTFFPPTTGQEPFTVPIAGKLTSSDKRPYDSVNSDGNNVPGPDHMFGSSVPYRYGFDPTLTTYYDFTDLPSFCTNSPTVWQQNETKIVIDESVALGKKSDAASAALKGGDAKKAAAILKASK